MNRGMSDFELGIAHERARIARESPLLNALALGLAIGVVVGFLAHWALF